MGNRYAGIFEETNYNENVATPFVPAEYLDIVSESIVGDQGNIYPETAGTFTQQSQATGPWAEGGTIDIIVNAYNMQRFMKWMIDTSPTPLQDGTFIRYTHTYAPTQAILSWQMELCPDDTFAYSRVVSGCVGSSMTIEAVAREIVTGSIDVVAATELLQAPTGTFPADWEKERQYPFVFHQGVVTGDLSGVANVEAFRWTFERNIPDDIYVLGNRYRGAHTRDATTLATLTGELDLSFLDWATYQQFLGTAGATTVQSLQDKYQLILTLTGRSLGGAAAYSNYAMSIDMPTIFLDTSTANFDRRERIVQGITWTAIEDEPASTNLVDIVIANDRAGV